MPESCREFPGHSWRDDFAQPGSGNAGPICTFLQRDGSVVEVADHGVGGAVALYRA